jgi:transcriptional regulator with XRE-family HTH domain
MESPKELTSKEEEVKIFATNLRFLREKHGRPSQEKLGEALGLSRSVISSYEDGRAEPKYDMLRKIAQHFSISVDTLITKDLTRMDSEEISKEEDFYRYTSGKSLEVRSLTVVVDERNTEKELITLVPVKAAAGYTQLFTDPEYIKELPRYELPFLPKGRSYRAFEISGDSMLPIKSGSIIIGEYVENWDYIKDGTECIVVVKESNKEWGGIVFKKVYNRTKSEGVLVLRSSNINHPTFTVPIMDVQEIWKFTAFISREIPDEPDHIMDYKNAFFRNDEEMRVIKNKLNQK